MNWLYVNQGGFLNSTLFFAIVTFLVGLSAYRIYAKQKSDKIREAATVVLSEVRSVVQSVPTIKEDFARKKLLEERRHLLLASSWHKYRYIILPALSIEQWSSLKSFYENVSTYDEAIKINDSYFDQNTAQIWIGLHKFFLKVLEEPETLKKIVPPSTSLPHDISEGLKLFRQIYIQNTVDNNWYSPQKPINMAREALDNIDENILVSSVGTELIKLAEHKTLWEYIKKSKK